MPGARLARTAAGGVALVAWLALALQFGASFAANGSVPATLFVMARYFTIIANVLVAVEFTGLAAARPWFAAPVRTGGVTMLIALVGIVFAVLLRGVFPAAGAAAVADTLFHRVVPVLVPLYWLACVPRGGLRRGDPWRWAAIPVLYLPYALVRGGLEGHAVYPFLDVDRLGWAQVAATACEIALGFVGVGFAMVGLDGWLARRARA